MKIKILLLITLVLSLLSCKENNSSKENMETVNKEHNIGNTQWQAQYNRIEANKLSDNVIDLIGKQWMLVTAGNKDSFNTMTASWGAIGYMWNRPASFIMVRDTRYTYEFLQKEEGFTLSFFSEQYRPALTICGTRSGRDTDKIAEAGLTPIETPTGLMSFEQARMIVECKKMFVQEMDYTLLTDAYKAKIMEESYAKEPSKHQLFISEITHIWIKK